MNLRSIFFLFFLLLVSSTMRSQINAPVTMAGFVVNPGPNVVVPVTVTNFVDIGAISLTLNYNVSIAQITSISPNVNLPGFTADWTTNPGRIIMGWYGSSGVTLPDNAHIVDISFTGLVAGETALTWLDNGGSCEYAKFDGGAFNVLPDSPTSEYYKNGYITCNQYGPVTVAPVFSPSAPDQDICIPIKIYQGTDVGAISLTLYYDPSILVFQGINTTTIPNTWSFIGQAVNPGKLIVGGFGPGISFPDGEVLFNACFHYNCGRTTLTWWDANGTDCEYASATTFNPYYDIPQSTYYIDGSLDSRNLAPVTMAGFVADTGPNVVVPITVKDFADIGAFSLTMDYDPSVAQITGVTPNGNLLPGFTADWTTNPGRIILGWTGSPGVTLPDNSVLADITFGGLVTGGTDLTWIDNGISCQYFKYDGGLMTELCDIPTGDYYKNGHIGFGPYGPVTVVPTLSSPPNQDICIPITVYQCTNIGAISLTLDYDPSVLIFQSINSATVTWPLSGQAVNPGRLIVGGFGPGISLPDGAVLFNACFHYNCGGSALAWWDEDGIACEYADAVNFNPYYDLPQSTYYIDGFMGSTPLTTDFIADNVSPPRDSVVTFTDMSTGNPTSWDWSFDRTSVVFINSTNAHSRNPQVQFTEGGLYTVTLVAHNAGYSSNKVKVDYIRVGTPGYWTGTISSSWSSPTNWDNWRVPDNLIDVLIPAAAANWPIYDGDLTIGVQCKTLTLEAITSQLTITGDLIIP